MAEIIKTAAVYSKKSDTLILLKESSPEWEADPVYDGSVAMLMGIDEEEKETGEVVGIEITDFSRFSKWDEIYKTEVLWQIEEKKPLELIDLLKELQRELT